MKVASEPPLPSAMRTRLAAFDRDDRIVDDAAELLPLRVAAGVEPRHLRHQVGGQPLEAAVVFVRDPLLAGLRQRIHPNEVGAAVDGEAKVAGEQAHRQARKRHREARAVGFHRARRALERCRRAANFLRLTRTVEHARRARWCRRTIASLGICRFGGRRHHQRRVPESVPSVLFDHLGRELDAGRAQRLRLLLGHPAHAGDDAVLGRQVLPESRPLAARFLHGELADDRLAAVDRVARPQLGAALPRPGDRDDVLLRNRRESGKTLVAADVALERIGMRRRCGEERKQRKQHQSGRFHTRLLERSRDPRAGKDKRLSGADAGHCRKLSRLQRLPIAARASASPCLAGAEVRSSVRAVANASAADTGSANWR